MELLCCIPRSPSCPAAKEHASFLLRVETPFNYQSLELPIMGDLIHCRQNHHYSSQPPLLPVQTGQNWQETNLLVCDRLGTCPKGGHSASFFKIEGFTYKFIGTVLFTDCLTCMSETL